MRILVTGGCGYIGSVLVPQLLDDEAVSEVVVLDSFAAGTPRTLLGAVDDSLEFQRGDVREYGDVERAMRGVDRVIHLAAITGADSTHDRREETFAVNRQGTDHVVTAAGKLGVDTVVFASSCNNYGRAASRNIDETTTPDPLNPYAEAKIEAEEIVRDAADEYGFDATSLRMSTNYGYAPGIRFNLVVNHFVFRGVTDRPLTVYGDGNNWRPFIHVKDAARAYKHAALHPHRWPADVYNVGSTDQNYRIEDVARLVNDELESPLEITYLEDKQPGPSYHVDFARLNETGFEPTWTLRTGIRELVDQFGGTADELDPEPDGRPKLTPTNYER
ncbi:NAD-dependent epimerase/dehydratase family protein [Natrinema salifodinae]|uniref:Nucleoside-diphosphate-sugar epimerase n=1 Tax=Natrinema salifodinae TaxID=1202768 RepID=A0A1I0M5X8_9EURY|nr:NAD(P)-dependent oxidoreductase [Natrinema salifodinae]SEV83877.1 Nucleoside-diphosphate-sugar epimerase [Natrinema salifodinae]